MSEFMRVWLVALTVALCVGCQTTPLDYNTLTDKVTDGEQVSVTELRTTFLELDDLAERMARLTELETQAMQLVEDEPLKLGSIGSAILDTYYGSLTGHYVLERFYQHVESPDAATPHHDWLTPASIDAACHRPASL